METVHILRIVEKHKGKLGGLLSILQDIQLAIGYLPEKALGVVADATGRSLTDLYGFATFHNSFRFKPEVADLIEDSAKKTHNYIYVKCPRCNHSLMDSGCFVEGIPSVRITVSFGMDHGWLRIPSSPDIDSFACEYEFPLTGIVNFFCPHCSTELLIAENCVICSAPMIPRVAKSGF
ncbi:MAG: hypothetical protein GY847_34420, partial [Proteobacteria bacterium]|nr:hypothetical protein [Pseudomonadota bacterium]